MVNFAGFMISCVPVVVKYSFFIVKDGFKIGTFKYSPVSLSLKWKSHINSSNITKLQQIFSKLDLNIFSEFDLRLIVITIS